MSNKYGFDFLQSQHTLGGSDAPRPALSTTVGPSITVVSAADVAHKPDLEKQADILKFLRAHRSAGHLGADIIYKGTGIDLEEADESVATLLKNNKKIDIDLVPDPENPSIMVATYAYKSEYNHVRDRATLLAEINRAKYCIDRQKLTDCYDGVEEDIQALLTAGDIIGVNNSEDKTLILFPRGGTFLVELDGIISLPSGQAEAPSEAGSKSSTSGNSSVLGVSGDNSRKRALENVVWVDTDVNPRKQIRRGEAVNVGGEWFRVSSAVKHGVPLHEQPARAQAPTSVTSLHDLSKRNEVDGYIRPFDSKTLPLDSPLSTEGKKNLMKAKEARQKLAKLAGNRSHSGGAGQLLSSNAHASNPTTLAQNFATTVIGGGRKRPTAHKTSTSAAQARKDAQAAQEAASNPNMSLYSHARRHGCTKDVREMYLKTRDVVPKDEEELKRLLIQHKLLGPNEQWRRARLSKKKPNLDNDGKPKKRRYYERKNQRMTNTHLVGTDIGAILAEAAEKQKQGKSVGDGGM